MRIWKEVIQLKNTYSKILTSSAQTQKFNMKTEETRAPILLYLWLWAFLGKKVTDWPFALSFAEVESNLAMSLAFNKVEHSAKMCFRVVDSMFTGEAVSERQRHQPRDDSEQHKPRTNPEAKTGQLRERCGRIPAGEPPARQAMHSPPCAPPGREQRSRTNLCRT